MNTNDRIGRTQLIPSDQVDRNRSVNMLVQYQKVLRLDYFDFVSENFSLVRTGSDKNYPETVFSNLEILFIVFLHIAVVNSPSSMHITTILQHHDGCTTSACLQGTQEGTPWVTTSLPPSARAALQTLFADRKPAPTPLLLVAAAVTVAARFVVALCSPQNQTSVHCLCSLYFTCYKVNSL